MLHIIVNTFVADFFVCVFRGVRSLEYQYFRLAGVFIISVASLFALRSQMLTHHVRAYHGLSRSAAQGNPYAQHLLDRKDNSKNIIIGNAVIRMLHHIGNIFRQKAAETNTYTGIHIDKKRRMEMMDQRIAMGHKEDDHEDPVSHQRL